MAKYDEKSDPSESDSGDVEAFDSKNTPTEPFGDGERDQNGRFRKGNSGGPGNPHAARIAQLRSKLLSAISDGDWDAVLRKLIEDAIAGDRAARHELFMRTLGKPIEADLIERIERLEKIFAQRTFK